MKLNKCFTTVFDAPLKERGFKKKGTLYYRMNGEILQGITIKLMSCYEICFNYIPYWSADYNVWWENDRPFKGNSWAENHFIDGVYYQADEEEKMLSEMKKRCDIVCNVIIPRLGKMQTLDDYLGIVKDAEFDNELRSFVGEDGTCLIHHYLQLNPYDVYVKAIRDRSFDALEKFLAQDLERHVNFMLNGFPGAYTEEALRESYINNYAECYKAIDENDFSSGQVFYEKQCNEMKQRLLDELKLTIE